ncbi:MAG: hypothetical protein HC811_14410, partial [Flammeovirgaceae bacterium]|nr:hypothetical protein [Flammeovirgaceae bacterium]
MSQFLFEEEQRFTRLGWIWIVALFPLIFLAIILSADQNLNFEKFSKSFGFAFIAYVPLLAILFISKLQVRINTQQVQYRFFPLLF